MTSTTRLLIAVAAGVGVGGAGWCVVQAFRPAPVTRPTVRPTRQIDTNVIAVAFAAAMVVLVVTRWPTAAAATAVLVVGWRGLFAGSAATRDRRRLDGIAKWLEDLRDLQQGSNLDLIETLTQAAARPPKVIEAELVRFAALIAHHTPLVDALLVLADELDHPVADTAIAAMVFSVGHASGGALYATFTQLAATARDELTARDRIDRMRINFERSMRRMLAILAGLLAYLRFVAADTLAPYRTAVGQVWLIVPLGIWAASLLWLRHLGRYDRPGRYLTRTAIDEAAR